MIEKKSVENQKQKESRNTKRRLYIGMLSFIIIAVVATIMLKRENVIQKNDFPKFKKDGELTFFKPDNKSIVAIDIEIADDPAKREVGMMGRPSMEEKQGMLFIFDEELMTAFWMRNTIVSLDMIFVNRFGEIITICKNTTPLSDQTYQPSKEFLFVIEVNAGFTDKYNILEGDRMSWKRK